MANQFFPLIKRHCLVSGKKSDDNIFAALQRWCDMFLHVDTSIIFSLPTMYLSYFSVCWCYILYVYTFDYYSSWIFGFISQVWKILSHHFFKYCLCTSPSPSGTTNLSMSVPLTVSNLSLTCTYLPGFTLKLFFIPIVQLTNSLSSDV